MRALLSSSAIVIVLSCLGCASRDAAKLREPAPEGAVCTVTAILRSERSPANGAMVPVEVERWWFDSSGRVLLGVSALRGSTTRRVARSYDARGYVLEERDEALDAEGTLATTTTHRVERDGAGAPARVLSTEVGRDGKPRASERAVSGNQEAEVSPDAEPAGRSRSELGYDAAGRLVRERWDEKRATETVEQSTLSFEYDPSNRLVTERRELSRSSGLFGAGAMRSTTVHYLYDASCGTAVADRVAPLRRGARDPDAGALPRLPLRAR